MNKLLNEALEHLLKSQVALDAIALDKVKSDTLNTEDFNNLNKLREYLADNEISLHNFRESVGCTSD